MTSQNIPFSTVAILGVGLMGGSLALALKKKGVAGTLIGWGRRRSSLDSALELGVVDEVSTELAGVLEKADLVVIATPTQFSESLYIQCLLQVDRTTVVTDVASTKVNLEQAIVEQFGEFPSNAVLGHPITGRESSGVAAAIEDLYENQRIILTPSGRTDDINAQQYNHQRVKQLWEAVGGVVSSMSTAEHDRLLGLTSHLPHLLSFALMSQLIGYGDIEDVMGYSGGGFRDFTRIAASDATMWAEIFSANKKALLEGLSDYESTLHTYRKLIESNDFDTLSKMLDASKHYRSQYDSIKDG